VSNISGPSGDGSLSDVVASTVFDLDATQSASYGGSGQTWANLATAPADSSAQTDYDVFLGNTSSPSSDDPTFTGSAGSAAAYWLLDGGDSFRKQTANTTFLKNLHKTTGGQDFWALMACQIPAASGQAFWGNHTSTTAGIHSETTATKIRLIQRGTSDVLVTSATSYVASTNSIFIVSHSHSTNQTRIWVNSRTADVLAHTFNTTTTDPSRDLQICDIGNGAASMNNLSRVYTFAMGNEYLDNTNAGLLFDALNTRHSRTYA